MFSITKPRVPEGLRDLMKDLTREILKEKPTDIYNFAEYYFLSRLPEKEHYKVKKFEDNSGKYDFSYIQNSQRYQIPVALVYSIIPESLTNLIKDLIKAILREQPENLCDFAVEYFRHLKATMKSVLNPTENTAKEINYSAYENYFNNKERFLLTPYVKCKCGRILGESEDSNYNVIQNDDKKDIYKGRRISGRDFTFTKKYINSVILIQRYFRRFLKTRNIKTNTNETLKDSAITGQLNQTSHQSKIGIPQLHLTQAETENVSEDASYTSESTALLSASESGRDYSDLSTTESIPTKTIIEREEVENNEKNFPTYLKCVASTHQSRSNETIDDNSMSTFNDKKLNTEQGNAHKMTDVLSNKPRNLDIIREIKREKSFEDNKEETSEIEHFLSNKDHKEINSQLFEAKPVVDTKVYSNEEETNQNEIINASLQTKEKHLESMQKVSIAENMNADTDTIRQTSDKQQENSSIKSNVVFSESEAVDIQNESNNPQTHANNSDKNFEIEVENKKISKENVNDKGSFLPSNISRDHITNSDISTEEEKFLKKHSKEKNAECINNYLNDVHVEEGYSGLSSEKDVNFMIKNSTLNIDDPVNELNNFDGNPNKSGEESVQNVLTLPVNEQNIQTTDVTTDKIPCHESENIVDFNPNYENSEHMDTNKESGILDKNQNNLPMLHESNNSFNERNTTSPIKKDEEDKTNNNNTHEKNSNILNKVKSNDNYSELSSDREIEINRISKAHESEFNSPNVNKNDNIATSLLADLIPENHRTTSIIQDLNSSEKFSKGDNINTNIENDLDDSTASEKLKVLEDLEIKENIENGFAKPKTEMNVIDKPDKFSTIEEKKPDQNSDIKEEVSIIKHQTNSNSLVNETVVSEKPKEQYLLPSMKSELYSNKILENYKFDDDSGPNDTDGSDILNKNFSENSVRKAKKNQCGANKSKQNLNQNIIMETEGGASQINKDDLKESVDEMINCKNIRNDTKEDIKSEINCGRTLEVRNVKNLTFTENYVLNDTIQHNIVPAEQICTVLQINCKEYQRGEIEPKQSIKKIIVTEERKSSQEENQSDEKKLDENLDMEEEGMTIEMINSENTKSDATDDQISTPQTNPINENNPQNPIHQNEKESQSDENKSGQNLDKEKEGTSTENIRSDVTDNLETGQKFKLNVVDSVGNDTTSGNIIAGDQSNTLHTRASQENKSEQSTDQNIDMEKGQSNDKESKTDENKSSQTYGMENEGTTTEKIDSENIRSDVSYNLDIGQKLKLNVTNDTISGNFIPDVPSYTTLQTSSSEENKPEQSIDQNIEMEETKSNEKGIESDENKSGQNNDMEKEGSTTEKKNSENIRSDVSDNSESGQKLKPNVVDSVANETISDNNIPDDQSKSTLLRRPSGENKSEQSIDQNIEMEERKSNEKERKSDENKSSQNYGMEKEGSTAEKKNSEHIRSDVSDNSESGQKLKPNVVDSVANDTISGNIIPDDQSNTTLQTSEEKKSEQSRTNIEMQERKSNEKESKSEENKSNQNYGMEKEGRTAEKKISENVRSDVIENSDDGQKCTLNVVDSVGNDTIPDNIIPDVQSNLILQRRPSKESKSKQSIDLNIEMEERKSNEKKSKCDENKSSQNLDIEKEGTTTENIDYEKIKSDVSDNSETGQKCKLNVIDSVGNDTISENIIPDVQSNSILQTRPSEENKSEQIIDQNIEMEERKSNDKESQSDEGKSIQSHNMEKKVSTKEKINSENIRSDVNDNLESRQKCKLNIIDFVGNDTISDNIIPDEQSNTTLQTRPSEENNSEQSLDQNIDVEKEQSNDKESKNDENKSSQNYAMENEGKTTEKIDSENIRRDVSDNSQTGQKFKLNVVDSVGNDTISDNIISDYQSNAMLQTRPREENKSEESMDQNIEMEEIKSNEKESKSDENKPSQNYGMENEETSSKNKISENVRSDVSDNSETGQKFKPKVVDSVGNDTISDNIIPDDQSNVTLQTRSSEENKSEKSIDQNIEMEKIKSNEKENKNDENKSSQNHNMEKEGPKTEKNISENVRSDVSDNSQTGKKFKPNVIDSVVNDTISNNIIPDDQSNTTLLTKPSEENKSEQSIYQNIQMEERKSNEKERKSDENKPSHNLDIKKEGATTKNTDSENMRSDVSDNSETGQKVKPNVVDSVGNYTISDNIINDDQSNTALQTRPSEENKTEQSIDQNIEMQERKSNEKENKSEENKWSQNPGMKKKGTTTKNIDSENIRSDVSDNSETGQKVKPNVVDSVRNYTISDNIINDDQSNTALQTRPSEENKTEQSIYQNIEMQERKSNEKENKSEENKWSQNPGMKKKGTTTKNIDSENIRSDVSDNSDTGQKVTTNVVGSVGNDKISDNIIPDEKLNTTLQTRPGEENKSKQRINRNNEMEERKSNGKKIKSVENKSTQNLDMEKGGTTTKDIDSENIRSDVSDNSVTGQKFKPNVLDSVGNDTISGNIIPDDQSNTTLQTRPNEENKSEQSIVKNIDVEERKSNKNESKSVENKSSQSNTTLQTRPNEENKSEQSIDKNIDVEERKSNKNESKSVENKSSQNYGMKKEVPATQISPSEENKPEQNIDQNIDMEKAKKKQYNPNYVENEKIRFENTTTDATDNLKIEIKSNENCENTNAADSPENYILNKTILDNILADGQIAPISPNNGIVRIDISQQNEGNLNNNIDTNEENITRIHRNNSKESEIKKTNSKDTRPKFTDNVKIERSSGDNLLEENFDKNIHINETFTTGTNNEKMNCEDLRSEGTDKLNLKRASNISNDENAVESVENNVLKNTVSNKTILEKNITVKQIKSTPDKKNKKEVGKSADIGQQEKIDQSIEMKREKRETTPINRADSNESINEKTNSEKDYVETTDNLKADIYCDGMEEFHDENYVKCTENENLNKTLSDIIIADNQVNTTIQKKEDPNNENVELKQNLVQKIDMEDKKKTEYPNSTNVTKTMENLKTSTVPTNLIMKEDDFAAKDLSAARHVEDFKLDDLNTTDQLERSKEVKQKISIEKINEINQFEIETNNCSKTNIENNFSHNESVNSQDNKLKNTENNNNEGKSNEDLNTMSTHKSSLLNVTNSKSDEGITKIENITETRLVSDVKNDIEIKNQCQQEIISHQGNHEAPSNTLLNDGDGKVDISDQATTLSIGNKTPKSVIGIQNFNVDRIRFYNEGLLGSISGQRFAETHLRSFWKEYLMNNSKPLGQYDNETNGIYSNQLLDSEKHEPQESKITTYFDKNQHVEKQENTNVEPTVVKETTKDSESIPANKQNLPSTHIIKNDVERIPRYFYGALEELENNKTVASKPKTYKEPLAFIIPIGDIDKAHTTKTDAGKKLTATNLNNETHIEVLEKDFSNNFTNLNLTSCAKTEPLLDAETPPNLFEDLNQFEQRVHDVDLDITYTINEILSLKYEDDLQNNSDENLNDSISDYSLTPDPMLQTIIELSESETPRTLRQLQSNNDNNIDLTAESNEDNSLISDELLEDENEKKSNGHAQTTGGIYEYSTNEFDNLHLTPPNTDTFEGVSKEISAKNIQAAYHANNGNKILLIDSSNKKDENIGIKNSIDNIEACPENISKEEGKTIDYRNKNEPDFSPSVDLHLKDDTLLDNKQIVSIIPSPSNNDSLHENVKEIAAANRDSKADLETDDKIKAHDMKLVIDNIDNSDKTFKDERNSKEQDNKKIGEFSKNSNNSDEQESEPNSEMKSNVTNNLKMDCNTDNENNNNQPLHKAQQHNIIEKSFIKENSNLQSELNVTANDCSNQKPSTFEPANDNVMQVSDIAMKTDKAAKIIQLFFKKNIKPKHKSNTNTDLQKPHWFVGNEPIVANEESLPLPKTKSEISFDETEAYVVLTTNLPQYLVDSNSSEAIDTNSFSRTPTAPITNQSSDRCSSSSSSEDSLVEKCINLPKGSVLTDVSQPTAVTAPYIGIQSKGANEHEVNEKQARYTNLIDQFITSERFYSGIVNRNYSYSDIKDIQFPSSNVAEITKILKEFLDSRSENLKSDIRYEILEEPCIKKLVEEEISSSTSSSSDMDDAEDSLGTKTVKLQNPEIAIIKMQKRRNSTSKISNLDNLKDYNFNEPSVMSIENPDTDEEGIVVARLQRDDTRESTGQSEVDVVIGSIVKEDDTFPSKGSLKRVNTIGSEVEDKFLLKSVTIDESIKYIEPPDYELNDSSLCLDDETTANIRNKMMAYSLSEADSDVFERTADNLDSSAWELRNKKYDDFNISTALIDNGDTSTETESTTASAVTKIQAEARGSFNSSKVSIGNAAISESLEHLVKEDAAKRIQKMYRQHYRLKTANANNKVKSSPECTKSMETSLAQKRSIMLQRGDALRNGSSPEEANSSSNSGENENGKVISKIEDTSCIKSKTLPEQESKVIFTDNSCSLPSSAKSAAAIRAKKIEDNKRRWTAMRQNSMPVQIDSEVLRVIPKYIRKKIKSAEGDKKKDRRRMLMD